MAYFIGEKYILNNIFIDTFIYIFIKYNYFALNNELFGGAGLPNQYIKILSREINAQSY